MSHLARIAMVSALALTPFAAQAQTACPTSPADLNTGIRIGFSGDFDLSVLRRSDGTIVEHETYNDGGGFLMLSRDGIVAFESANTTGGQVDTGSIDRWEYSMAANGLPMIEEGTSFSIQRTAVLADQSRWPETMNVRVDRAEPILLGGCRLTSMRVSVEFQSDGTSYYETYQYLQELDFGIYLGGADRPSEISLATPVTISVGNVGPMPSTGGGTSPQPVAPPQPGGDK